jgi:uncharacterized protein (TIGR02246 family)
MQTKHDMRWAVRSWLAGALCALTIAAAPVRLAAQSAPADGAVRAAMTEFIDALNALDVGHMSRCFTADVTAFVPAAQGGLVDGRHALTAIFQRFADAVRPRTPKLALVPQDVRVQQSGDLAVVTFQIVEHSPPVTRRRTFVFRREGGRWLISHMHASDFFPRS